MVAPGRGFDCYDGVPRGSTAVVVDDRVACDAMGERVEAVLDAQIAGAAVQPQQHLLGHVVYGVGIADPPADEAAKAFVKARDELVSRRRARFYWHPQLAAACLSTAARRLSCGHCGSCAR